MQVSSRPTASAARYVRAGLVQAREAVLAAADAYVVVFGKHALMPGSRPAVASVSPV